MIVTSLTLHNFGLYAGDHTIDLSMTGPERPVILIGGMNGRGKTTILEAVLLALYGKQSFAFTTSRLSYGAYLKKYISTGVSCHDAYVEIKLRLQDGQPELTIRRSWTDAETGVTDQLTVYRGGDFDPYLSENWPTFMETILPAGVSKLFFFDGEKITELANDQTDEGLKASIKSLLGIDTIDRLISDLGRIVARQETNGGGGEKGDELEALNVSLEAAYEERGSLLRQIAAAEERIRELKEDEAVFQREITSHGGDLVRNRTLYMDRRATLKKDLKGLQKDGVEEAAGALPLAMVSPLLKDLIPQVEAERERSQRAAWDREVQKLRSELQRALESYGGPELALKLEEVFAPYRREENPAPGLGGAGSDRAAAQLTELCGGGLERELKRARRLVERRRDLEEQIALLDQYIKRAENEMEVEATYDKLRACVEEQTKCGELKKALERTLKEVNADIHRNEREARHLKQDIIEAEQKRIKEARTVRYANLGIQVMERFREKLQRSKVAQLERLINRRFQRLSEKQNLVADIEVDPVTLSIALRDQEGGRFSITKLSAGERQMLVIALLWAMASCLENPLPVMIDTPLARLDSRHRENFVREYLPQAGQQVIVLSTDEEISGSYAGLLEPYVAAEYLLEYDPARNQTAVRNGYFGR